ncbi:MAG: PQQ-binding-like beta-propeller repeat protein, partial [Rhodoferax sp.]
MGRRLGRLVMGLGVVILAACSGPERAKPAELGPNPGLLGVRQVWTASIGSVNFPLNVKVVGHSLLVGSGDGVVAEIDSRTGGDVWRLALGAKLAAGVGSDGRYTAVVSRANEVIVVEGGREIWRQRLAASTLTPPLVAGARVFTLSADRSVASFDAAIGQIKWQQQRSG